MSHQIRVESGVRVESVPTIVTLEPKVDEPEIWDLM
jgi:hypothetical protein